MYQANVIIPKTEVGEDDDIIAERDLTPLSPPLHTCGEGDIGGEVVASGASLDAHPVSGLASVTTIMWLNWSGRNSMDPELDNDVNSEESNSLFWISLAMLVLFAVLLMLTGVLDYYENTEEFAHKVWNPGNGMEYLHSFLMAGIIITLGLMLASGPVRTHFPYGQHVNPPEYGPGLFGFFLLLFGAFIVLRNLYHCF